MDDLYLEGIMINHLGHSSIKIQIGIVTIYTDPYQISDSKGDIILISHDHPDHLQQSTIIQHLKEDSVMILPISCASKLQGNIKALKVGDTIEEKGIKITGFPAYNLNKPYHPKAIGYLGFIIEGNGKRLYFAGDTDNIPEMSTLQNIEIAFLPIGGTYTMNEEEAALAANTIRPKTVIPMHFNVVEGTRADPDKFASLVEKNVEVKIFYR